MRGRAAAAGLLALGLALAAGPSPVEGPPLLGPPAARAEERPAPPATLEEARARFRERCRTRRVRPEVPEAGDEALALLCEKGGLAPAEAYALVSKAAFSNDWSATRIREWSASLARLSGAATLSSDAFAEKAWEGLGRERPAPERPLEKEAPGARLFAAGEGPSIAKLRLRWAGGDLERASALADPDPVDPRRPPPGPARLGFPPLSAAAAKEAGLGDGAAPPEVDRYLVYLTKDATTWWPATIDELFSAKDDRFVAGAIFVPSGNEVRFTLADPAPRLSWRAAYVFADAGGKRLQLRGDAAGVALETGPAPPAAGREMRIVLEPRR